MPAVDFLGYPELGPILIQYTLPLIFYQIVGGLLPLRDYSKAQSVFKFFAEKLS